MKTITVENAFGEFPTCPTCGTKDQDWWDGLEPKSDGDQWQKECDSCGTTYLITMCVSVDFLSSPISCDS